MNAIKKIVMGLAVASAAVFCSAADIYVATTGNDSTGDGTPGNPYATIATGIAAAKAAGGGTIHVADSETAYATPNATLDAAIAVVGNPEHPENVVINDATAGNRAFKLSHADAKVAGVTITGTGWNTSGGRGGHITMSAGTVEDCIIQNGNAGAGSNGRGGNVQMSGGSLVRCVVRDGTTSNSGESRDRGANIFATGGVIENCLVTGGKIGHANAANIDVEGPVKVVNCTIVKGPKKTFGAIQVLGVGGTGTATAKIVNCVFYGNGGTAKTEWGGNTAGGCFINCAFAKGLKPAAGTGCIDTVTDAAFADYENGNYCPAWGVLVGSGVSENDYFNTYGAVSTTDLAGNPRVSGSNLDIGAYAFVSQGIVLTGDVSSYAATVGKGLTFTAVAVGTVGEVEYLWDFGDGTTSGWTAEASLTRAYAAPGSFTVSVKARTESQGETEPVLLPDGDIFVCLADIYADSASGDDTTGDGTEKNPLKTLAAASALAQGDKDALMAGVTIHLADGTYDAANMALNVPFAVVGNVADPSKVVINDATAGQCAFTLSHADAKVAGVTITGTGWNTSGGRGGHVKMSAGTVEDCVIQNGNAGAGSNGRGGNVQMSGGSLVRCVVRDGTTSNDGTDWRDRGANIFATGGVIENCLVTGGKIGHTDAANIDVEGPVKVVNCTIVKGPKKTFGAIHVLGVGGAGTATAQIVDCVFYGNGGTATKEWGNAAGSCFKNCAVASEAAISGGTNNIDTVTAAAFKDYDNGDYRLASDSVLKGAGTTWDAYHDTYCATSPTDLAGTLWGKTLDIGCYAVAKAAGLMLILR